MSEIQRVNKVTLLSSYCIAMLIGCWLLTHDPDYFFKKKSHQTRDVYILVSIIHILRLRHKYHIVLSCSTTSVSKCNFQHVISQKLYVYKEIANNLIIWCVHHTLKPTANWTNAFAFIICYQTMRFLYRCSCLFTFIPSFNQSLISLNYMAACTDHFITLQ